MKLLVNIFRGIIFIIGIIVIAFNAQLYIYCKQQRSEINTLEDKQKLEAENNSHAIKHQQDQIESLSKDLEDAQQQVKLQNDTLTDQKDENKNIQISMVDIKAELDALKQDMKSWQKDDVTVLAQIEKRLDDAQSEIKKVEDNLDSFNIRELKMNVNLLKAEIGKIKGKNEDQNQ